MRKLFSKHRLQFVPKLRFGRGSGAQILQVLRNLDRINEKDVQDPEIAQEIFLLKNREEFARKVEKKLVPKILDDIAFILEERCAQEISKRDFNHVHLCKVSYDPIFDIDTLLSNGNVRLLYHTCEEWTEMPYYAKRNIKSSLTRSPEIIPINYEESVDSHGYKTYAFSKTVIHSSDLGWSEYGKMEFEEQTRGRYTLRNGARIDLIGLLDTYALLRAGKLT